MAMGTLSMACLLELKEALCTAPILLFLDPKLPYTIVTYTYGTVAGGVLTQDQGDGL